MDLIDMPFSEMCKNERKFEDIPHYPLGEVPDELPEKNEELYRLIIIKRAMLASYEEAASEGKTAIAQVVADMLTDVMGIDFNQCVKEAADYYHQATEREWFGEAL